MGAGIKIIFLKCQYDMKFYRQVLKLLLLTSIFLKIVSYHDDCGLN